MTEVVGFVDSDAARWARFRMANGDPCWLGVARTGVLVKRSKVGLFGRKLFEEKCVEKAAQLMHALDVRFPEVITPSGLSSPVLQPLANAVLHCNTVEEVEATFMSASSG